MISCLVHTYNSQRYIEWCLKSLTFCDEIVIVDMYSTDRTIEIARRFTDKIFFTTMLVTSNQRELSE